MTKEFGPWKKQLPRNYDELFKRKMTPEVIEEAKALFHRNPMMTCKDVADSIRVSKGTLRSYLPDECWQATQREFTREQKRRDQQ